jgi:hypothetical protein
MEHLKKNGVVISLKISFEEMVRKLNDITTRRIVLFLAIPMVVKPCGTMTDELIHLLRDWHTVPVATTGQDGNHFSLLHPFYSFLSFSLSQRIPGIHGWGGALWPDSNASSG